MCVVCTNLDFTGEGWHIPLHVPFQGTYLRTCVCTVHSACAYMIVRVVMNYNFVTHAWKLVNFCLESTCVYTQYGTGQCCCRELL